MRYFLKNYERNPVWTFKNLNISLQALTCIEMKTRRDVFQAIADPTRREIINMLTSQSQNVNSIAEKFDVSRQAISLHIKILKDCGMITIKQIGNNRFCEAKLDPLSEVSVWVDRYRKHWENKLDSLDTYLEKLKKEKYGKRKK
jgi:DNA-binding transcriptional ArsR family regulator